MKFKGLVRKSIKNESLKMYKANRKNILAENTRFFEHYVRILALNLGDNPA